MDPVLNNLDRLSNGGKIYNRNFRGGFHLATSIAFLLFFLSRSVQWDLNGIIEIQAIMNGGKALFSQNHLLYRPLGYLVLAFLKSFGFTGHSAEVLQIITILMASLTVGIFWSLLFTLTSNLIMTSLGTVFLATSWAFWSFSTDVYYITPAALFVVVSICTFFTKPFMSRKAILLLGLFVGLSVLFWQANIFLVPLLLVGISCVSSEEKLRIKFLRIGSFLIILFTFVGSIYIFVGKYFYNFSTYNDFRDWIFSHSSEGISIWGVWSIDRIPSAINSALASFIPVWEGLGIKDALKGVFKWEKLLAQFSLFVVCCIALIALTLIYINRMKLLHSLKIIPFLLLGYCVYIPFIIWWDPYEPKWFVIPNLFLIITIVVIFSNTPSIKFKYFAFGIFTLVIAITNFHYSIWPRHSQPNAEIQIAKCFVDNSRENDTIIITDWSWFPYAEYFYNYEGDYLSLIGNSRNNRDHILDINEIISETNQRQGHVYMKDLSKITPKERILSEILTGFSMEDLRKFQWKNSFSCGEIGFIEIIQ